MALKVSPIGVGLMGFTWNPSMKFLQSQFNSVLKGAIEAKGSDDSPLFLNAGEFYGIPDRHENLKIIGKFFEAYPEHADHVYLSVKSGVNAKWAPDVSPKNLAAGVEAMQKYLEPLFKARQKLPPKVDMYTLARVGKDPIEKTMENLIELRNKTKAFEGICLSEASAETLKKAHSVEPLAATEVEFSLFSREAVDNGVFEFAADSGVPAVCYSPLGKGLLAGLTPENLPENDMRANFDRFQSETFLHNRALVDNVADIASRRGVTPAEVALGFIVSVSGKELNGHKIPQLIPIPGSTNRDRALRNLKSVELPESELQEITDLLKKFEVKGKRYNASMESTLYK